MDKMQFLKIEISSKCCTSQADGKGRIVEFCNINTKKLWDKLYHELKFEKYVSSYSIWYIFLSIFGLVFAGLEAKKFLETNAI